MKKKLCSLLALVTCLCMSISAAACDTPANSSESPENSTASGSVSDEGGNSSTNENDGNSSNTEEGGNSSSNEGGDSSNEGGGSTNEEITEDVWEDAITLTNFDNVTFKLYCLDLDQETYEEETYMLDGVNSAWVTPEDGDVEIMDEETTEAIRNIFISTSLMILDNFANFTYDEESGYYVGLETITYTVDVMEYLDTEIIASNIKAKFDENFNITEISCDMIQNFIENGEPDSLSLQVTFTFWDYGTTEIPMPSQSALSQEEWNTVFENALTIDNVTAMMTNNVVRNEGEPYYMEQFVKTTATSMMIADEEDRVEYFAIENDQTYCYRFSNGTWVKYNSTSFAPIGSMFMQMYTAPFVGLYNDLTYNAETNAYEGKNIVINQGGMDYTLYAFSIKIADGKIVEIEYTSDVYSSSGNGEMVISGKSTINIKFSDYGTTVVELPQEYTDDTTGK
ncbi:MAG: hypothetical protein IKZ28_00925 [Clostridia bacterium]|nr:hypothetical protein [Clostridia bacterium]